MSRRHLHVLIDAELAGLIDTVATADNITTSAIVRDALRAYFKLGAARDRGWREGFAAGLAQVQRRVRDAIADLEKDGDSRKGPFA